MKALHRARELYSLSAGSVVGAVGAYPKSVSYETGYGVAGLTGLRAYSVTQIGIFGSPAWSRA